MRPRSKAPQASMSARVRRARSVDVVGRLVAADDPDRLDRRFAHDRADLVGRQGHQDEATALLAQGVERHRARRAGRHVPGGRRTRVRRLDDVVPPLDATGDLVQREDAGDRQAPRMTPCATSAAQGSGVAAQHLRDARSRGPWPPSARRWWPRRRRCPRRRRRRPPSARPGVRLPRPHGARGRRRRTSRLVGCG